MNRPLEGYRVADFGHHLAGPLVGMMLSDLGADVIRISAPAGTPARRSGHRWLDRGKRRVVLDLKSPGAVDRASALVETCDVLIENFRPGVMDRLGLGADAMRALNPGLVYLSLPGFSASDPARSRLQAWEGVILAAAGVFRDRGTNHRLRGLGPSYVAMPLASSYGAALGTVATLTALLARKATGRGDRIEVPLYSALLEALSYNSLVVEGLPERYREYRERELLRRVRLGEPLDFTYEQLADVLDPLYGPNLCSDGRYYYLAASSNRNLTQRALVAMGLWDELVRNGLPQGNPYRDMARLLADGGTIHGYQTLSSDWFAKISAAVRSRFLDKSSFEWEQIFIAASVPGAAVRSCEEWLSDEHPRAAGLVSCIHDAATDSSDLVPGPLFWFPQAQHAPPPAVETLTEFPAWKVPRVEEHRHGGEGDSLPLAGITILDLTAVIAGPTIGSTLHRYGAEVIKIDPVAPAFDPLICVYLSIVGGRGKKSALIDLRQPEGFATFAELVRRSDVVTYNGTGDQLERLGIGFDTLKAINRRIVLCQLSAFAGPCDGARKNHLGYDETLQAASGIMARAGGALSTPEEHAYYGTIDVVTGYLGAAAVAAALLARERTDQPVWTATSLAAGAQLIQAPFLFDTERAKLRKQATGPAATGEDMFNRIYALDEGWVFLSAGSQLHDEVFSRVTGCDADDRRADRETMLAEAFKTGFFSHWETVLDGLDIGFQFLETMTDIRSSNIADQDALTEADSRRSVLFLRDLEHPSRLPVVVSAPVAIQHRGMRLRLPAAPRKYGADTRSILEAIGRSYGEIARLLATGAVAEAWSDHETFLPR